MSEFKPFTTGDQVLKRSVSYFGPYGAEGTAVRRVGLEHWAPGFHIGRLFTNRIFLALIDAGRARCTEHGRTWTVLPQHLLCLGIHRPIEVFCDGDSPLCLHLVVADLSNPEALPGFLRGAPPVLRVRNPADLSKVFTHMFEVATGGLAFAEAILNRYLHVLFALVEAGRLGTGGDSGVVDLLRRCKDYLSDRAGAAVSLKAAARDLGVSHAYMCRLFRQHENCTPRQFHSAVRMRLAAERLIRTERTLDDIAAELGISSAFALSKMFKRQFGLSPRPFRRIERTEEGPRRGAGNHEVETLL